MNAAPPQYGGGAVSCREAGERPAHRALNGAIAALTCSHCGGLTPGAGSVSERPTHDCYLDSGLRQSAPGFPLNWRGDRNSKPAGTSRRQVFLFTVLGTVRPGSASVPLGETEATDDFLAPEVWKEVVLRVSPSPDMRPADAG